MERQKEGGRQTKRHVKKTGKKKSAVSGYNKNPWALISMYHGYCTVFYHHLLPLRGACLRSSSRRLWLLSSPIFRATCMTHSTVQVCLRCDVPKAKKRARKRRHRREQGRVRRNYQDLILRYVTLTYIPFSEVPPLFDCRCADLHSRGIAVQYALTPCNLQI